jgi:pimeloyl-ACP methyl ester carboxylesterase
VQIACARRGGGPRTVILIHGLGSRGTDLAAVADALGEGWTCLLPDLRGHGESPAREGARPRDFAADLAPLARAHSPVEIAGQSFGALVAMELWRSAPDAVARVALVDPPLDPEPLLRWARAGARDEVAARRRLLAVYRERDPERLAELMRDHPLMRDLDGAGRRRNAAATLAADGPTLLGTVRTLSGWRPPSRPPGSAARVVVLRATASIACPPAAAARLVDALGGRVAEFAGGHCAHLSAPAALGEALRAALT